MFGRNNNRIVEDVYRTNDGGAHFCFRFVEEGNGNWRADIQSQPSYGSRSSGLHDSHRLPSITAKTRHQICYGTTPRSLRDAQKWAEAWAEATWTWIRDGRRVKNF